MSRIGSKLFIAEIQKMIAGLQQHYAGQTVVLAGKPVKVDDLIKQFNSYTTQDATTAAARQAWLAQTKIQDALQDQIDPSLVLLHAFLINAFGVSSGTLTDFGMTPRATKKRTAAQKVATAQKAAATRTARHTVGPRQKAQIHGAPSPAPVPDAPKK